MSNHQTLEDTLNVTFSQALEDGLTHYGWLVGPMTDQSGQDRVLVSHLVLPGRAKELQMIVTYGPLFGGLSLSADLQSSLENKLHQNLDVNGSPEYVLTWKRWDMKWGPPICRLRAWTHHTLDKGYGGLDGWPRTPRASDGVSGVMKIRPKTTGKYKLRDYAAIAGWPTTTAQDAKNNAGQSQYNRNSLPLNTLVQLTILKQFGGRAETGNGEEYLSTGTGNQSRQGGKNLQTITEEFCLPNMDGWKLNHRFSLWLMGFPAEWACSGEQAMQSIRR